MLLQRAVVGLLERFLQLLLGVGKRISESVGEKSHVSV